jgi:hypothetical protein
VFGQIKTCQKLTTMSRRGLDACRSEWLLVASAHNRPTITIDGARFTLR